MANEIKLTFSVNVSNSNYTPGQFSKTVQINQSAVGAHDGHQTITTTGPEALTTGDLASPGVLVLRNLDSTNYLNWGSSGQLENKLKAGEVAITRVSTGATIYAKANTAAVKLWRWMLED